MTSPLARGVAAAWFAAALLSCGPGGPSEFGRHDDATLTQPLGACTPNGTLPGVDVSIDQGNINWGQAAGSGIKWAYAKATESTDYRDNVFPANWAGMQAAGVARGAYHFFHPDVNGTAQADWYLAYVGSLAGSLPPMLDWEITNGASGATARANALAFINEIQAKTGRETVIYTSPGFWPGTGAGNFGGNPLWVADWTYSTSQCPQLPSGWSSWVFWQWSDKGSVPGIPATVDLDVFNGNATALANLGGSAKVCNYPLGHPVGTGGPITSACGGGGPPGLPGKPTACGGIPVNQGLGPGDSVTSCDGRFVLIMQGDGNVVLYAHGIALWSTGTAGKGGYLFVMQGDGNLVLYSDKGCPLWASDTAGHAGASLAVQSDGNLVVYGGGAALWSSGSGPLPPVPPSCGTIPTGDGLGPGDALSACHGCFTLVMQGDGNLVTYKKGGGAIWATGTNGQGGEALVMQSDGNLVVYSGGGCALWSSGTSGHPGARAAMQDDGNLVVYSPGGAALWASNSVACTGGCNCLPPPPPPPVDAGQPPPPPPKDAGEPPPPPPEDAGQPPPTAEDAGTPPQDDAGVLASDAGHRSADAGPSEDAGQPHGGGEASLGSRDDGGTQPILVQGGCHGCGSGAGDLSGAGLLLALAIATRRRRTLA